MPLPPPSDAPGQTPQPSPSVDPSPASPSLFGSALEPALREACGGKLSSVSWFRTDWQRGGALTGYAAYHAGENHNGHIECVVKLPVPPHERHWLVHLQDYDHVAPRLYAHGETLGDYDIAWVVMERIPHGPLGAAWNGREFDLLIDAAGRFYLAAADVPLRGRAQDRDWREALDRSRKVVRDHNLPHEQRWSQALKKAQKKLDAWIEAWEIRPVDQWCHGDLHLGNAMTRTNGPEGPAVLLDYAETRPGCWIEDAVYFEHLFWARRERLGDRKLCKMLARKRKELGLTVEDHWADLAATRRALIAMTTPGQLAFDGDPRHVEAALNVLEAAV